MHFKLLARYYVLMRRNLAVMKVLLFVVFNLFFLIRILIISLVSVTNSNKCQGTRIKSETFRH